MTHGRRILLPLIPLVLVAAPLTAQENTVPPTEATDPASILQALDLPRVAEILRQRGVPTEEIEAAIESARQRAVPPEEMAGVMEETAETVDETGPIEGFGAFVQERLAEGLRGRELAEAIRAEHARRGIGPGNRLDRRGPPEGRGPGMRGEGMPDTMGPPGRPGMQGRRGGPPDSMRGGPPDSVRRGPPDSVQGGRPDTAGGGPPGRGGGRDTTRRGGGGNNGNGGGNGGQR